MQLYKGNVLLIHSMYIIHIMNEFKFSACLETGRRLPRRHTSADLLHHNMSRSMHSNLNNNPAHHADDMSRSATQPTSSGASSSSSSANTSPTAGAEPAAPRRRYRRAYPYYTVEDHVSNTFSFFFDGYVRFRDSLRAAVGQ